MQLLGNISTCGATAGVFARPGPICDISWIEISQRSSPRRLLRPYSVPERLAARLNSLLTERRETRRWLGSAVTRTRHRQITCLEPNSSFQAQFLRLKARHGAKKAAIAVAASILTTVYHMLRDGTCYQDLGPEYSTRRNPAKAAARLANRIRNLGCRRRLRRGTQRGDGLCFF
jgi:hypothetical protein